MHSSHVARERDRRQTLAVGLLWLLLTCLATSYCNIAAPLVCLDLLEHVHADNFPGDEVPIQISF